MPSLALANGIEFQYTDSGIPTLQDVPYVTVIAVHGMGYNGGIFNRVQQLAKDTKLRIVAINRRQYAGSTPISDAEAALLVSGSDEQKAEVLAARGVELALFIVALVKQESIPPISTDREGGGVALLGWSSGNVATLAMVANTEKLPSDMKTCLATYMRALILQEPPSLAMGYPLPPGTWSPHMDPSIPPEQHTPFWAQWITSYFDHGDFSSRDPSALSHIVPSFTCRPTIYDMTVDEQEQILDQSVSEMPGMFCSAAQALANTRKACFDPTIRALLPNMKIWHIAGTRSASFAFPGRWNLEDDDKANGGALLNFMLIPGMNHFMQWDDPQETLRAYLEAL